MSQYLNSRGDRLLLPHPPLDDLRYWRHLPEGSYLTREGIAHYRQQIEAQEKSQRDRWISYLTAATGLVGAFIGLAGLVIAWLSLRKH